MGTLDDILADGCFHSTAELTAAGVTEADLARAFDEGRALQYRRGVWIGISGLVDNTGIGLDHASATFLNPDAIVCLFSATSWHELCDDNPAHTWLAKDRTSERRAFRGRVCGVGWSGPQMTVGIESHVIAGVTVRVTDPARTVVDVLRYRHRYGDEQSVRALHDYVRYGHYVADLWHRAEALGCLRAIEPFYRCAHEFRSSIPVVQRTGYNLPAEKLQKPAREYFVRRSA